MEVCHRHVYINEVYFASQSVSSHHSSSIIPCLVFYNCPFLLYWLCFDMNLCIPFHTCAFNTPIPYLCVDCSFSCNPALYLGCCLTESQADFSDFHFPGAHAVSDLRFLLQVFLRCFFYMFCCSACLSRLMGKTSNHGLSPWLTLNFH